MPHAHDEGTFGTETGLREEVDGVAHETGAAEGLDDPDEGGDFGSSEISPFEALDVACPSGVLDFELIGMDHHSDGFVNVEICKVRCARGCQAEERELRFFDVALAEVPPRGFWGEDDTNEDWDGPYPLNGERNAVGPFVSAFEEGVKDTSGD